MADDLSHNFVGKTQKIIRVSIDATCTSEVASSVQSLVKGRTTEPHMQSVLCDEIVWQEDLNVKVKSNVEKNC